MKFPVLNTLHYIAQPLPLPGLETVVCTGAGIFSGAGVDPVEAMVKATAKAAVDAGRKILILDIAHLPLDIRKSSTTVAEASLAKFLNIVDWVRLAGPSLKLGFYGIMPFRDYWPPVDFWRAVSSGHTNLPKFRRAYASWQFANDFLRPLAERVDYLFPSLYTFYADQPGWILYAKANIWEARRYGKLVVPFIWPEYHNGTPLIGQYLSADYWRMELETLREHADGMVLWGGWKFATGEPAVRHTWDESAPWWVTTQAFLKQLAEGK